MSELTRTFVQHLKNLQQNDRGALATLRRSVGFAPGTYPPAYPYVERFSASDAHSNDSWRQALYLSAGLFAMHPLHVPDTTFASAFGCSARKRESDSIEKRFITLLSADSDHLSNYFRQTISILAADDHGFDYALLISDLTRSLNAFQPEQRDKVRQQWARDFYRELSTYSPTFEK